MRQVMIGDMIALARRLMGCPPDQQAQLIRRALWQAHCADKVMKRLGRPHPVWGNGSLAGAVSSVPGLPDHAAPEPFASEAGYLEALCRVIHEVLNKSRIAKTGPSA